MINLLSNFFAYKYVSLMGLDLFCGFFSEEFNNAVVYFPGVCLYDNDSLYDNVYCMYTSGI